MLRGNFGYFSGFTQFAIQQKPRASLREIIFHDGSSDEVHGGVVDERNTPKVVSIFQFLEHDVFNDFASRRYGFFFVRQEFCYVTWKNNVAFRKSILGIGYFKSVNADQNLSSLPFQTLMEYSARAVCESKK